MFRFSPPFFSSYFSFCLCSLVFFSSIFHYFDWKSRNICLSKGIGKLSSKVLFILYPHNKFPGAIEHSKNFCWLLQYHYISISVEYWGHFEHSAVTFVPICCACHHIGTLLVEHRAQKVLLLCWTRINLFQINHSRPVLICIELMFSDWTYAFKLLCLLQEQRHRVVHMVV